MTAVREKPAPSLTRPPAARPSRSTAHPNAILGAILAGAVATSWLWWNNTASVHGLGDWLTNAGRICGLLAGYGVVVLVALMARIPPLERGIGADRLARWHALGGRYTVSLVCAHALLIIWGYSLTAHTDVVSQTSSLIMSYPDVLMATVAGLLLLGVGVVSARAARRRMSYETWYYLHLYTYLAVALAFSHQFATGAEFIENRAARIVWSLFYATVGAAILWYRILVPITQNARHRLRVEVVYPEAPGVFSIVVSGRRLHELCAESGQFFRWRFLTKDLWWASSPYSLSAAPRSDRLRITVKQFGAHSAAVAQLRPGTRVFAEGPYGAMTDGPRARRNVLLIAGGIGVTPLRALFESIPSDRLVTLLYRTTRETDVVFAAELTAIADQRGARLHILVGSRAQLGCDPLSRDVLVANVPGLTEHEVYVCGPTGMTDAVLASLRQAKVPRRQLHHESFEF